MKERGRGGGGGLGQEGGGREERVAEGELELLEHPLWFTAQQYNWDNGQNKAVQQRPLQACHLPSSVAHFSLQHNTVHRVSTKWPKQTATTAGLSSLYCTVHGHPLHRGQYLVISLTEEAESLCPLVHEHTVQLSILHRTNLNSL